MVHPAQRNRPCHATTDHAALGMIRWSHWSLRRTLLVLLVPGLLAVLGLDIVVSWRNTLAGANAAFDRSLLGAVKAMDANISTASGGLSVELPYRMLEFFELTASGQVFYRVASDDNLVEIGNDGLPPPPQQMVDGQPQFYDGSYFGVPIRVGSYSRPLERPLAQGSHSNRVLIQVAETLESRQEFTRRLVLETVARDVLLLIAALGLVALSVEVAVRPLQRLRDEVAARSSADLTPVNAEAVPADVRPLVDAINQHASRYRDTVEAQRRFVDDASHQLRTPLTTLATQVGFALREHDSHKREEALRAIKRQVDDAIRQTNQMLALARTDAMALHMAPVDLQALAESVTKNLWPLARQRGIDLGVDALPGTRSPVLGYEGQLAEALSNLLHNALVHVPVGGHVTVWAGQEGGEAILRVADDGPGIPEADRQRAGERFFRVQRPVQSPTAGAGGHASAPGVMAAMGATSGSGLGLAIASAVAQRHGGSVVLGDARTDPVRPGLVVTFRWPAKPVAG